MKVKITERGWPGHFICVARCVFRRNTLIEYETIKIIVSTVGNLRIVKPGEKEESIDTVGSSSYYETMAFHAECDGYYWDIDVGRQVAFEADWTIDKFYENADNDANDMHEVVVKEITDKLIRGEIELTPKGSVQNINGAVRETR